MQEARHERHVRHEAAVAVAERNLVLVAGRATGEAYVVAYDAATGEERWLTRGAFAASHRDWRAPLTLAVSPDGSYAVVAATWATGVCRVTAFDTAAGSAVWSRTVPGWPCAVAAGHAAPDAGGWAAHLVVGGDATAGGLAVRAFRGVDGDDLWTAGWGPSTLIGGRLGVTPDGRAVVVAGGGEVNGANGLATVMYDAATGEVAWAMHHPTWTRGVPGLAVTGSRIFVVASVDYLEDADHLALDTSTGAPLWVSRHPGESWPLVVADPAGERLVTLRVRLVTGGPDQPTPFLWNGGSDELDVRALDGHTGEEAWTRRVNSGYTGSPTMAVSPDGGSLVVSYTEQSPYSGSVRASGEEGVVVGMRYEVETVQLGITYGDTLRRFRLTPDDGTLEQRRPGASAETLVFGADPHLVYLAAAVERVDGEHRGLTLAYRLLPTSLLPP